MITTVGERRSRQALREHHATYEWLEQVSPDQRGAAFTICQDDEPSLAFW